MRRGWAIGLGAAGAVALLLVVACVSVFATAGGRLRAGEFLLGHSLHRRVMFKAVQAKLLTANPTIHAEGVVIASPPAITTADLLRAKALDVTFQWSSLLTGHIAFKTVAVTEPQLHLVRLGKGRNNYTFGPSGSGSALRAVQSLSVSAGRLVYDDPERHIRLEGDFSHQARDGASALRMQGGGVAYGQPFTATATGAQLNARAPNAVYPFSAHMVDAETELTFSGSTVKPFDFRGFDMQIKAKGPNLADLHYLLGVDPMNSPPFSAEGHVQKENHLTRFTGLVGRIGASDLAGGVTVDDRSGRRKIGAQIKSHSLKISDLTILLTRAPGHELTRQEAGRANPESQSGPLSSKPFSTRDLLAKDLDLKVDADAVSGAPIPLSNLHVEIHLNSGLLVLSPVEARINGSPLRADLRLDARGPVPLGALDARLSPTPLSRLNGGLAKAIQGDLAAHLTLAAKGASPAAMVANTQGRASLGLSKGLIQKETAEALSGDLFKGLASSLLGSKSSTNLQCAGGRAVVERGVVNLNGLRIFTDVGQTDVNGTIGLSNGALSLTLTPRPAPGSLAKIAAPIQVVGPFNKPKISVKIGEPLQRKGPGEAVKLVLSPLTGLLPQRTENFTGQCAQLLGLVR